MITTPTLYLLEREVKRLITAIEDLNTDKLHAVQNLKNIEEELNTRLTYLNDFNKNIEILKHGKSNSQ